MVVVEAMVVGLSLVVCGLVAPAAAVVVVVIVLVFVLVVWLVLCL